YGGLVGNAPRARGAAPGRILESCDELLVVLRADRSAGRTLRAFLRRLPRQRDGSPAARVRGVLLRLPAGKRPGCLREQNLRGRFGDLILPQVIPHDPEVARAQARGQVLFASGPPSPAAAQYRALAEALGLTEARAEVGAPAVSAPAAAAAPPAARGVPQGPHADGARPGWHPQPPGP